ncbi:phosphate propanoyltransferase [Anaerobacillus alkaliphilus]|uniref:phosphate propanoyltransferase n=1 Tax=Anaerobacillus alkaliphilus TaxID=1548597 RepID=UPI003BAC05C5
MDKNALLEEITRLVVTELKEQNVTVSTKQQKSYVPVSISARHIHLQRDHLDALFGKGYQLTKHKDISQPGQWACNEKVTIQGPKGKIENVRVLSPLREATQVEVASSDARKLGLEPPVRSSGNLTGSAPITIIGPKGTIQLQEGCIIADRHIHMTPQDAMEFGVRDKQKVSVKVPGGKGGLMGEVTIRVRHNYALDMHIDTDDANAFGLSGNEQLQIIPD